MYLSTGVHCGNALYVNVFFVVWEKGMLREGQGEERERRRGEKETERREEHQASDKQHYLLLTKHCNGSKLSLGVSTGGRVHISGPISPMWSGGSPVYLSVQ